MKKLNLNLEDLQVESFDTAAEPGERGTVHAHLVAYCCYCCCCCCCCTCGASCGGTCYGQYTCAGYYSCDGAASCNGTCDTCPDQYSCWDTCGSCYYTDCGCQSDYRRVCEVQPL